MERPRPGRKGLARFGEPSALILLALSDGPKHGYAISAGVQEQTGISLGPGTLRLAGLNSSSAPW